MGVGGLVPQYLGRVLDAAGLPVGTCFQVASGVVVTARHVLLDAGVSPQGVLDAMVLVDSLAGEAFGAVTAEVVAEDMMHDLAVLRLPVPLPGTMPMLTASSGVALATPIVVTGHVVLQDDAIYRHLDAPGTWAGVTVRDDAVALGRLTSKDILRGMSGAPVRRASDGAVLGVVSARYNSADGWLRDSVWLARSEDIAAMLEDFADVVLHDAHPSAGGSQVPGAYPSVWNVPRRNLAFSGRKAVLDSMRGHLIGDRRAWVYALNGIDGVGKTQLAIEYAHLFAGDYELVWWIDSQHPELIGEQIAALGAAAEWVSPHTTVAESAREVAARLRHMSGWLLIFDNVEDKRDLRQWLPDGTGHVVITSRRPAWIGVATPLSVEVFSRSESVEYIESQLPGIVIREANALAAALGDLPLAISQATGLLAETRLPVEAFLLELDSRADEILDRGTPMDYPRSLRAAVLMSLERLEVDDPHAIEALSITAALAAQPVRLEWFETAPDDVFSERLATVIKSPLALREMLARISNLGLARFDEGALQLHRLTQAVIRNSRNSTQLQTDRSAAAHLIAAAAPSDSGEDPHVWPAWAAILPHLLELNPSVGPVVLRRCALRAHKYLMMRGEYETALLWAEAWHQHWSESGPDAYESLQIAHQLSDCYRYVGRHRDAFETGERTFMARRRLLGQRHPETLVSANALAYDLCLLGQYDKAYELGRSTFETRQRLLGSEHPDTLKSANNLASYLRALGLNEEARELEEATLNARLRVLGTDHPLTLHSASGLALALYRLARFKEACALDRSTYETRCRVLGHMHPDTLVSAKRLRSDLLRLGLHVEAAEIEEKLANANTTVDLEPWHNDSGKFRLS